MNELNANFNELKELVLSYLPIIRDVVTLYSELIIALLAATILGWFIGTMIQRGRTKRLVKAAELSWEKKYLTLEETAKADSDALDEQLQSLVTESKSLQETNRVLTDSLKKNDTSMQKARAEAIELNRQHAETQERLQRIIQQKDSEILQLDNRSDHPRSKSSSSNPTHSASNTGISNAGISNTGIATKNNDTEIHDSDLNSADTIAMDSMPSAEMFDATVQIHDENLFAATTNQVKSASDELEISMDDTADLADLANADILQESTAALDDDALANARHSYPAPKRD